jgi:hypothetical protein
MFGTSWRAGRIAGIEVRVDSSWVVIALLITYSMYLRFSILHKDLSTGGSGRDRHPGGGATRARVESRGPGDEVLIAAVGPAGWLSHGHGLGGKVRSGPAGHPGVAILKRGERFPERDRDACRGDAV